MFQSSTCPAWNGAKMEWGPAGLAWGRLVRQEVVQDLDRRLRVVQHQRQAREPHRSFHDFSMKILAFSLFFDENHKAFMNLRWKSSIFRKNRVGRGA